MTEKKDVLISFRVKKEEKEVYTKVAASQNITMSDLILNALRHSMAGQECITNIEKRLLEQQYNISTRNQIIKELAAENSKLHAVGRCAQHLEKARKDKYATAFQLLKFVVKQFELLCTYDDAEEQCAKYYRYLITTRGIEPRLTYVLKNIRKYLLNVGVSLSKLKAIESGAILKERQEANG